MNELVFLKNEHRAFDRNGREIHVGDRVKIRGDETLIFLQDYFGDCWPEHLPRDVNDDFGTVVDDEFLQIVNEDGDMLYDLSLNDETPDPCLEIVTDDNVQDCSKSAVSTPKKTQSSTIPELEDSLTSWFGEDGGRKMFQALSKKYPTPPKCVYVLLMKNGTVKIGVTQNFDRRMDTISTSSGLEVVQWCHTEYLPKKAAYSIESTCHKVFASRRIKGEFFDVLYESARAELAKHAKIAKEIRLSHEHHD